MQESATAAVRKRREEKYAMRGHAADSLYLLFYDLVLCHGMLYVGVDQIGDELGSLVGSGNGRQSQVWTKLFISFSGGRARS